MREQLQVLLMPEPLVKSVTAGWSSAHQTHEWLSSPKTERIMVSSHSHSRGIHSRVWHQALLGGETRRQHIPVVGLSQSVGNALNHSEGENQSPKYSLALELSKRPSA
ncbi:hypothetical protein Q5P01_003645 [Channa striata]|uniref:Uncharacterized protein n=1 Tax=Channa striata TaxID=64152 RepID=A0AA88NST3_CHASR|nr:hypothetical protein Q5P01_003645 [Channa striata]